MHVEEHIAEPPPQAALLHTLPARTTTRGVIFDVGLFASAGLVFGACLLVLIPAPTSVLWITSIIVTEWGHFVAIFCLLLAIAVTQRRAVLARCAAALLMIAAMLCMVPLANTRIAAGMLAARTAAAFGEAHQATREPLSVVDLFRGVRTGNVSVTEHIYASIGSKTLKLDLYQSGTRTTAQPLVIVIHGGSWNGGDKRELPALDRFLASQGYTVAAINYRHAPKWHSPSSVEDVFSALDFLRAKAADFGIDASNVVLIGRSAGGQIALSAAYAKRDPAIRGVVSFYAPVDLPLAYANPSAPGVLDSCRVLENYLGGTPAEVPDAYAHASPINFVDDTTPPTLLIHGGLDPIVAPFHSEELTARLQDSARPNLYLYLPWATHGCDANLSGPSGQLSLYAIERFLGSVLPTPERPKS
jgi:acetyl esterase/lipase